MKKIFLSLNLLLLLIAGINYDLRSSDKFEHYLSLQISLQHLTHFQPQS